VRPSARPLRVLPDPATLGLTEPNEKGRQYRHATLSAYTAGRCRCEHCRGAFAAYRAKRRAQADGQPRTRRVAETDGHISRNWFRRSVCRAGPAGGASAGDVAGALAAVTAREPRVIVDLAGLDFIDASGLAALVSGWKHARRAGGDLLLAAPQPRVLRVLAATRLLALFSVHPSVEEAVSSAGSWRRVAAPVASPVVLAAP
jgi:anti-anti-sigma factor